MCGIVGYVGTQNAVPILIDGLRRLEYRGYDSAGIAVSEAHLRVTVRKAAGKLCNLENVLSKQPVSGTYGIAHTRWATHGRPSERNAHPHSDCSGNFVVVHNGIIENYAQLKQQLEIEGHCFRTETDSEVLAHLVEKYFEGQLEKAVMRALKDVRGAFALSVVSNLDPGKIVAVREGPPVVVGLGNGEHFIASDVPAILAHTRSIIFLADGDIATITTAGVDITDFAGRQINRQLHDIKWDPITAERGGYRHYMLKEIHEQPRTIRETLAGRLDPLSGNVLLDDMRLTPEQFRSFREIRIVACGTSWHAALAGRFMIESLARIPVQVDYGSEFRYRDPVLSPDVLTVVVSQSGETADTLAAQRQAKALGSPTIAICNVFGSMITRESEGTIYTHAGPEISVASTKAFTGQLTALLLLALHLGQVRKTIPSEQLRRLTEACLVLPEQLETILQKGDQYVALAAKYHRAQNALYLGRGIYFPIALEGALKLKELSYIHAEGYPAGEMKHGPNALITEDMPVVVMALHDPLSAASLQLREKTMSNIQEVKARDGKVIAIVTSGDLEAQSLADDVIEVPAAPDHLLAILGVVPLQLFAYQMAVRRGADVDQPRNLAKSVTVE